MTQDLYSLIFCCRYLFTFYFSCFSFIMFLPPTTKTLSFLYVLGSRFTFTCIYIFILCVSVISYIITRLNHLILFLRYFHCILTFTFFIMDAATIWIKPLLSHSVLLFRIYLRCSAVMLSVHSMNSYLSLFKYNSCVAWGRRNWVWKVHAQFSPTESKI